MKRYIETLSENSQYLNQINDLGELSSSAVKKIGKGTVWLQYAKKTKYGYRFLNNKNAQQTILEDIATKVCSKNHVYPQGKVVDILSYLVNTTVKDEIGIQNKANYKNISQAEIDFQSMTLICLAGSKQYIPLYPWLMPLEPIKKSVWQAKDLTTGKIVAIKRSYKGKNTLFKIRQTKVLKAKPRV